MKLWKCMIMYGQCLYI